LKESQVIPYHPNQEIDATMVATVLATLQRAVKSVELPQLVWRCSMFASLTALVAKGQKQKREREKRELNFLFFSNFRKRNKKC
jgi:hypothetical protein